MRKHPLAECEVCPLQAKPCAPTLKPATGEAKAAIVSRSPGYHEGMAGRPFAGPSGQVLDHLLKLNGVKRDECLVTNTVLCAPEAGKVPPEAIKACAPRLHSEIQGIDLVIACGSEAVNELIGRGAIDRYRGQRIRRGNHTLVATNNPALVLRDDSTFPNLKRDFQRAFHPLPAPTFPKVVVIEDVKEARDFLRDASKHLLVACDIESRGGLSHKASLISVQFSFDGINATVLGERGDAFDNRDFIDNDLRPYLQNNGRKFIWHGGKFDTKILQHTYGINARVDEDTMLLSYALDERSGSDERIGVHGLEYLLMDNFGWPRYASDTIDRIKKTGVFSSDEDYDRFYEYAGYDVGGTLQLFNLLKPLADRDNVYDSYRRVLLRGNDLLTKAELAGMVYDVRRAADTYEFGVEPEMVKLAQLMRDQIDMPMLNPRSPTQISAILHDRWGVKHAMQKRPDVKYRRSVDDAARKEILEDRFTFKGETLPKKVGNMVQMEPAEDAKTRRAYIKRFVTSYDRFQSIQKQASTYLIKMIERAERDPEHRVYTQLNLHGTNSGRLSSSRPNLQNITRTREGLPDIRTLFRASEGRSIVSADFSQAELRCIASFSGDKELTRIYVNDLDLHNETAKRFYGEDYTYEQRSICKNVNFGVFYRQGAATFQEKHGIPERKAQPYIDWVWSTFTGVKDWEVEVENQIRKRGTLVSPFGRKRRFYLLTRDNLQAAYREGINFYPQSTASDLTLCSAIRLGTEIDWNSAQIVLLVHDSIIADVGEDYVDEYKLLCKQIMESSAKDELGWELPFRAEVAVGQNWGECK